MTARTTRKVPTGKGVCPVPSKVMKTDLIILGMRSNDCRERLISIIEGIRGVLDVEINLHRGLASILHSAPCDLGELTAAIISAGYGVAPYLFP